MKTKWFVLFYLILLIGCEESINITLPTILIEDISPSVFEEIEIRVEEYADIEGDRVYADYFLWSVEDNAGNIIKNDFADSSAIFWVPEKSGYFIIKVKIGYDGNKSISAIREINVNESLISLKQKITGHWTGTGTEVYYNREWSLDLYIDSSGHYYGSAEYNNFDPYCEKGVFNTERLDYFINWQWDSCGVPGEVPCQRLEINEIVDNKGIGVAWIGWISYNNGILTDQSCTDVYKIEDMEISIDGNELYFEFNNQGNDVYEWVKKFQLSRQ